MVIRCESTRHRMLFHHRKRQAVGETPVLFASGLVKTRGSGDHVNGEGHNLDLHILVTSPVAFRCCTSRRGICQHVPEWQWINEKAHGKSDLTRRPSSSRDCWPATRNSASEHAVAQPSGIAALSSGLPAQCGAKLLSRARVAADESALTPRPRAEPCPPLRCY